MAAASSISSVKFSVGQLVHHRLFNYRGVIVDVDPDFQGSDEWYEYMARSRPPKDYPWYHVLVHDSDHATYVAEQNLEADDSDDPIDHPVLGHFFAGFDQGQIHQPSAGKLAYRCNRANDQ